MNAAQQALARARSLVAISRWQDAIGTLGPALAESATAGEAHCLRAQCLLALGKPRDAAAAAKQALAVEPGREWAHRLLAISDLRTGRRRAALTAAREAVKLDPSSAHTLHTLAVCQLALRHRTAAQTSAQAALEANPQSAMAELTAGLVAEARRDWDGAEHHYREGLRLEPEHGDLALRLGRLLHRRGRRNEAAEAYLAAARSNPTDARVRHGLSRLGVPVLGGGVALLIKLVILNGALRFIGVSPTPLRVALVLGIVLAVAAMIDWTLRLRGTRGLPDHIRTGLRSEHRNSALRALRVAALFAFPLGVWCALISRSGGGGAVRAAAFFAFAVAGLMASRHFWIGPRLGTEIMRRGAGQLFARLRRA
ncbi:MAG TPA: tetratricopeptide repeat protein [Solirubrobacteraceae bacterium]